MISSFKETKFYFENLFAQGWRVTPIHFAGMEFDSTGIAEWINIFYVPMSGQTVGLGSLTHGRATLHIVVWGENDVVVMDNSDKVLQFMHDNAEPNTYRISRYEISDHGWQNSNQVYMELAIDINVYDGVCSSTQPPITRTVGVINNGNLITNNGNAIIIV